MTEAVLPLARADWYSLTSRFADLTYRQVWEVGVAGAARVRASSEHIAVCDGDDVVSLAEVRIRRMPLVPFGIAYVGGGPLVRLRDDSGDYVGPSGARLGSALDALRKEYVERRRLVLRVAPSPACPEWALEQDVRYREAGYVPTGAGRHTMLVDLDRPEDVLRAGLAQKWRNSLNRADKAGLEIVSSTDPRVFDDFLPLFDRLVAAKDFDPDLGAAYYATLQPSIDPPHRFHVQLACCDGRPVAGHVASVVGDTAVYLLGASDAEGRSTNAAYLLQWRTMLHAKALGCRWYDVGGIDREANPGVYHFKKGLSGFEVTEPGPFEIAPSDRHVAAMRGAETAYAHYSNFRSRLKSRRSLPRSTRWRRLSSR